MNAFPTSIEASLLEAGFSATEILILKRLLEGEPLTLRQMAAKTGKSTGVLDQAMKKLLRKDIVMMETINEATKYSVRSLESFLKWMEQYTKEQREVLLRRHQNFQSFISSLELDNNRPDIQYFEGMDGIQQAYRLLLEAGQEMMQYVPLVCSPEDDPLRDFRVEYFRERRRRGVFSRVIAHNTPLGRRYQTRDAFEYRQTLLVPEEQFPFSFEKIITGDTIACFNHIEKRACLLRYPELAASERGVFDLIWRTHGKPLEGALPPQALSDDVRKEIVVPVSTKILSALREFFLSRAGLVAIGIFTLISAIITVGVFRYEERISAQRIRERLLSIVATGALQFDYRDLEQIHSRGDIGKPEYRKIIATMNHIRSQNGNVKYMYIFRPTTEKHMLEFVADADSIDPDYREDMNGDGVIDAADENIPPGQLYDARQIEVLRDGMIEAPIANPQPYSDQWGTLISAFAPIRDAEGRAVALLGVDVFAHETWRYISVLKLTGIFVALLLLLLIVRFAAFHRSLLSELFDRSTLRGKVAIGIACAGILCAITIPLFIS